LRQILVLLFIVFAFLGCNQKQVVQLKMPGKQAPVVQAAKPQVVDEDKTTVIEEFTPVEVFETDVKEQIMNNSGSKNEVLENDDKFSAIDTTKANVNIAFVYPKNLIKYSKGSISTVGSYLSYKNIKYNLKVIELENEDYNSIENTFSNLKNSGFSDVIALFTPNAINSLSKIVDSDFKVYLPLIEKKNSLETNDNLIFGSISYEEQLKKLSYYSNGDNVLFYQNTYLSKNIKKAYNSVVSNGREKEINNNERNFKGLVSGLNNSTLYLNIEVVKSAMLLSQLRASNVNPNFIFGTQANYDLNLLNLTQEDDRKKMLIANSIPEIDKKLREEINSGGADLNFSWVDYSTLVGINYLVDGNSSLIPTKIDDNQAIYTPRLFKATAYGFVEIK
jgi:hypothetical protein